MDAEKRAREISSVIEMASQGAENDHFAVTTRGGCGACDPGACRECGYLFSGEIFVIEHDTRGKRVLSDKTVHYLAHGITRYETGYVVHGAPVVVDLDVEELAAYLDL